MLKFIKEMFYSPELEDEKPSSHQHEIALQNKDAEIYRLAQLIAEYQEKVNSLNSLLEAEQDRTRNLVRPTPQVVHVDPNEDLKKALEVSNKELEKLAKKLAVKQERIDLLELDLDARDIVNDDLKKSLDRYKKNNDTLNKNVELYKKIASTDAQPVIIPNPGDFVYKSTTSTPVPVKVKKNRKTKSKK